MKSKVHAAQGVLKSLCRSLCLFSQGISGGDRRAKQRLMLKLSALTAEYNQLNQEMQDMQHQMDLENQGWRALYEAMKAERDDLQLEVWELEDLVEELFRLLTSVEALPSSPESTSLDADSTPLSELELELASQPEYSVTAVDLSLIKLALIGGHDATRRAVIDELSQRHGLIHWVELPPFCKHSLGRSNIKAKIQDCDLIVLITGYMKHKQTNSVMQLRKLGNLSGDILLLNCRGKSGVVREILAYVTQNYWQPVAVAFGD